MSAMISIVMPCFNSSKFIGHSIRSVLSQTYQDWEMIIVDDCSTDDSVDIIKSFMYDEPRISLIKLPKNLGPDVARNQAIQLAQGKYVAFLDSDDIWFSTKLSAQLAFMASSKYRLTYTGYKKINENGENIAHVRGVAGRVSYSDLLKTNSIICSTAMYDREYFGDISMPKIRKRQDLGLWLKLVKIVEYAHGLNEPLIYYRVHKNSTSANKFNAASFTWRLYREVERVSLARSVYYFGHYAVRGILRTKLPQLAEFLGVIK